jgi:starch synthase
MHIVHVAAELDPFFRSGGLGVVAAALPRAQKELGYNVAIVAPYYEAIISKTLKRDFKIERIGEAAVEIKNGSPETSFVEHAEFYRGVYDNGVPVYFIGHKKFFAKRKTIYGKKKENARFYFFDVAVLALLKFIDLRPDIIHCHDWHAGLIPYLLKNKFKNDPFWEKTASVYTIHNLAYQLGRDWWKVLSAQRDEGHNALPPYTSPKIETINFAKRGILYADVINTVSETYREEIFTKDFGEDLHRILKNREKIVYGIVNGIDYDAFNPLSDPGLVQHYSDKSIDRRGANKDWLQKHFGFEINSAVPVICMTSRVVEQKGYHLLVEVMHHLMDQGIQFIIMGNGQKEIVQQFEKIAEKYPKNLRVLPFDSKYETSLYAGSDMLLLPSRFEPCGINQMIALRYGCIPIVHHIGGLVDTIKDYDARKNTGNGFVFKKFTSDALLYAVARAIETFKHKESWVALIRSGMTEANSWRIPAQNYTALYKTAIKLHKKHA